MIEASDVTKRYGTIAALENVSFSIGQGEVVGLLGPNGAGKTTLLRALTGYFEPSAGQLTVDGIDVVTDPRGVQQRIGYLPETTPLYPEMLVQEYLMMVAELREVPVGERTRLIAEAVLNTGLEEHLTRPIGELSKGFRQRVGLAQAILHRPKVLILDEPTSGLDPTQVAQVRDLIRRLAESTTVLFSTHILSEVEQLCERAIVILGGRLEADARLDDLRQSNEARVAVADGAGAASAIREALAELPGSGNVRPLDGTRGYHRFAVTADADGDLCREIFRLARDRNWELGELSPVVRDLDSVFRELVANHRPQGAGAESTIVGPSTEEEART